ncbi:hypothetical protein ZWY2020_001029 [Hordeum vulgare]|nr:hypothetical protein ZWY2020_001029 [Hordeum vulgare]
MRLAVVLLCALVAVRSRSSPRQRGSELVVGYYDSKCRGVENVVKWHVRRLSRPTAAPAPPSSASSSMIASSGVAMPPSSSTRPQNP